MTCGGYDIAKLRLKKFDYEFSEKIYVSRSTPEPKKVLWKFQSVLFISFTKIYCKMYLLIFSLYFVLFAVVIVAVGVWAKG